MGDGYGQHYESMYTGSMVGAGAVVFAVMGYVIANTRPRLHTVDLNPVLLATIFGESIEDIEKAIGVLCAPDPKSRTKNEEGRRLLKRGEFTYFVVNHEYYRGLSSKKRRNDYMADLMASKRAAKTTSLNANTQLTGVNFPASASGTVLGDKSVREGGNGEQPPLTPSERISAEKELTRIDRRLGQLSAPNDYAKDSPLRAEVLGLRGRRQELTKKLGVMI